MRRGLLLSLSALVAVLLCLWLGLIPLWGPGDEPDSPVAGGEAVLEKQVSASPPAAEPNAANESAPRPEVEGSVDPPEPDESSELVLLAGYTLDESDRPIAGTEVDFYEAEGWCENSAFSLLGLRTVFPESRGPLDELTRAGLIRLAETVSDRDGYFEFRVHRSSDGYHFRCVGPERLSLYLGGPFSTDDSPVRLRLQPAHVFAGVVQDAASETRVTGATVDLIEEDVGSPKEDWGHLGERGRVRRVSDTDGLFSFDLLPAGSYRLEVLHPDYPGLFRQIIEIPVDANPFLVSLSPRDSEVVISGHVRDALTGLAVAGAEISHRFGKHRAISGPAGEYRMAISEKDASHVHLTVTAVGYGVAKTYFRGRVESRKWDIALHPARRLTCRVVTVGERPVAGAKVFVRATISDVTDGQITSRQRYSQVSDADGLCEFTDLPAVDTVEVFGFHPAQGSAYDGEVPLSGDGESDVVTLELDRGPVTVIATVRDLDGAPVSGARVLLLQPRHDLPDAVVRQSIVLGALADFGNLRVGTTGADGKAGLPGGLDGEILVQAIGEGYPFEDVDGREDSVRSEVARFHTVPNGLTTCELVLWRTYRAHGRVTTPEGDALEGVVVSLLGWSEGRDWVLESPMAYSNQYGNYRFTGLSPVRRFAVAVQRKWIFGGELQRKRWKKVSPTEEPEAGEQEYSGLQGFSSRDEVPEDLLYFAEIPAPEAGEARVDIVVEFPPR